MCIGISVLDCESLIRKMLVLEPSKRYCVAQIKRHRWMQIEVPQSLPPTIPTLSTQPNEQILRLMQSLGIDSAKTKEVGIYFEFKLILCMYNLTRFLLFLISQSD